MLSFPKDSSGLLVGGGSMANFVGIAVAKCQSRIRCSGIGDAGIAAEINRLRLQ